MTYAKRFVQVDGLKTRRIEAGSGAAVILLDGAPLGSFTDVFERNSKRWPMPACEPLHTIDPILV